ncbi:MAG: hypothetical protein Ct9H300mP20_16610 [Gammaproteobacteria bacterium]|nr:MAG: hypothetical protein Ct9H300mP20_16610 [Gammaproteobacteria bacterium]
MGFCSTPFNYQYEVSALDLTGMGSSDHREHYSPEVFGKEIIAVAKDSVSLITDLLIQSFAVTVWVDT